MFCRQFRSQLVRGWQEMPFKSVGNVVEGMDTLKVLKKLLINYFY